MDESTETLGGARREPEIAAGTRLAIIRHGEAVCNVGSFVGGHVGCRGLTEHGIRQSEALAKRLANTGELAGAAAVWTSILPRAIQTAEIVSGSLGHLRVEQSCGLCERHPGEADGLSWEEFERRYKRKSLPGDHPDVPLSPGGESWIDFLDRAARSLSSLAASYPGELVIVVAHGGIIDASIIRFLGMPEHGTLVRLHPEHTSITEWQHTGHRWRFARYNDSGHLEAGIDEHLHSEPPDWVNIDAEPREKSRAQQV